MVRGQCNCGEVGFEISADISAVYICHCSICRKATGNNGVAVVIVDNSAFRWAGGENRITTWTKPNFDWQWSFCQVCGSPLPGVNDESSMAIPAGLITEGGDSLKVEHHIWVDSKAVWDEIADSGKRHGESLKG